MKKRTLYLSIVPLLLTCCGQRGVSLDALISHVNGINNTGEHPYYRVNGSIDIHGKVVEISEEDGSFYNMPNGYSYVENARYNEGFYCPKAERMTMDGLSTYEEEDIVIFGMSSRSYWLRMPIRLHKDNFYVLKDGELNRSCGYANLKYLITAWADVGGTINPDSNAPYYEILPDGGFAVGGENVRTKIYIDNYPYYMSYNRHPELCVTWDEKLETYWDPEDPLPCYSYGIKLDGRFNIRFEYDKDGWLRSEYLATSDYDYGETDESQLALRSVYSYTFN